MLTAVHIAICCIFVMHRSMKMFKTMNSVWGGNKPPTLNLAPTVYEEGLPGINDETVKEVH